MRRLSSILSFAIFCAASTLWAAAQNYVYDVGNQQWGTNLPIENGYINVNNGEIHLEFPLATHAQRGSLSLNEKLVYDSRIWQIVNSGSGLGFQPTNVPNSQGGWRFVAGNELGNVTISQSTQVFDCYVTGYSFAYAADTNNFFSYTDSSGSAHYFAAETQKPQYNNGGTETSPCINQAPPPNPPDVPNSSGTAIDGSGY